MQECWKLCLFSEYKWTKQDHVLKFLSRKEAVSGVWYGMDLQGSWVMEWKWVACGSLGQVGERRVVVKSGNRVRMSCYQTFRAESIKLLLSSRDRREDIIKSVRPSWCSTRIHPRPVTKDFNHWPAQLVTLHSAVSQEKFRYVLSPSFLCSLH